jgi:hypothetical protein
MRRMIYLMILSYWLNMGIFLEHRNPVMLLKAKIISA